MSTDQPSTNTDTIDSLTQSPSKHSVDKIEVLFKAVGGAPIMKQKKFKVYKSDTIASVSKCIRAGLKLNDDSKSLFIYVNQSFAPSIDQNIENLYQTYGADGRLTLHYALCQAWG